jgi:hypothetical protein
MFVPNPHRVKEFGQFRAGRSLDTDHLPGDIRQHYVDAHFGADRERLSGTADGDRERRAFVTACG